MVSALYPLHARVVEVDFGFLKVLEGCLEEHGGSRGWGM
jgi:hypothetical protein